MAMSRLPKVCPRSGEKREPTPPGNSLVRLALAIVEFDPAWAPHLLSTMDYSYRERHGEAIYRFKDGMLPSDFFRRNVVLSFQEDAIGIRLRDAIGVDNMMWGSDYPHSESTFPQGGDPGRRAGR
jgi:hypothetical protein